MSGTAAWKLALATFALSACAAAEESVAMPNPDAPERPEPPAYANWPDPLLGLRRGAEQKAAVCGRGGDDAVRDAFCSAESAGFGDLRELQTALGLSAEFLTGRSLVSNGGLADLAITGHSTGLSMRSVSAINPRVISFRVDPTQSKFVALSFTRGEQFVELIARDRSDGGLRFYLASFRQACNATETGCSPGDLLTPAVERDWTELTLYDESDLANTVVDCATCHQPNGPDTPKTLLMQELNAPWTHWFWRASEGGQALLDDYFAAKGDEPLAGMSAERIRAVDPTLISVMVVVLNPQQVGNFDSIRVEDEVKLSAAALGGGQPFDNSIPGESATWREAYESAKRGETISLPYHNVKVTDPEKLEQRTAAYAAFRRGELEASALPDLRDVFPDDPQRLAELGFQTEPGLDGRDVLLQACSQCHSARLDQSLSRARFRADLSDLSREQKDLAIARLKLPETHPLAMPPARLRVLRPEARARAIEALRE